MKKIAFLWRKNSNNVGDRVSGWPLYFDFPEHDQIDLDEAEHKKIDLSGYDKIIIGGGMYPELRYYPHINELDPKKVLCAGVGINFPDDEIRFRSFFRQLFASKDLCPCPSCMSCLFDVPPYRLRRNICVYQNIDVAEIKFKNSGTQKLTLEINAEAINNTDITFDYAIDFIKESKRIITSSYHGYYWAALLGVPCTVVSDRYKMENAIFKNRPYVLDQMRDMVKDTYLEIMEFINE